MTITLQAPSLAEKVIPVQVRFTTRLRDQGSMQIQDGCKVYMDFYMASNGSCFMVTWTIFKTHLLKIGLTQKHWETMALRNAHDRYSILSCVRTHVKTNSLK